MSEAFGGEWFQRIVETSGDIVMAVDGIGNVLFVNDAVSDLLGYAPEELVGNTALQLVAPDDQMRAVETLLFAASTSGIPSVLPFRLVAKGGKVVPFELLAESHVDDPVIGASIIFAREATAKALAEETLDALVTGADLSVVLRLLVRMFDRQHWDLHVAASYEDESADRRVLHSGLPEPLRSADVEGSPLAEALHTGEPVVVTDMSLLPDAMRDVAVDQGFAAVWAYPVVDPGARHDALLIVWNEMDTGPVLGQGLVLERVLRLMRLALAQRNQLRQLEHAATHDALTSLPNRAVVRRTGSS